MNRILVIGGTGNIGRQVVMLLDAWAAALGQPAFVTSTVRELTGTPARTYLDWVTTNAAAFRA